MKVEDLKLNNYIYLNNEYNNGVYQVSSISDTNEIFINKLSSWYLIEYIEPIKIIDEFLMKYFEDAALFYTKTIEINNNKATLNIERFKDKWKLTIIDIDDTKWIVPVKYIHELQNEVKHILNIDLNLNL